MSEIEHERGSLLRGKMVYRISISGAEKSLTATDARQIFNGEIADALFSTKFSE